MHSPAKTALLLVDIQNDFLPPDGSLAVPEGRDILPHVYRLLEWNWDLVVASQDYHPHGHISFTSTHDLPPFTNISVQKPHCPPGVMVPQMLWPDHCVQGTHGCEFEAELKKKLGKDVVIIQKGGDLAVDSYSAFSDNQYTSFTPLIKTLHQAGIEHVVICGLATDYCVYFTAVDSCKFGFKTEIVREAVRAADKAATERVFDDLRGWGCDIVSIDDVLTV
ncbi:pyrazinamidase/nicotinamidase-like protein [Dacryopinax primogenitus]|uniref:nicotinamidase n=1 Tax=Dacryopinax primogenitus (strain DJM 731) TaxID=1858805 RepID=M5G727_DACPD|nr:pyrazinamidase/nicotinamidase-like protein [Dacryopinax primogenitus]EJU06046.1 pyrazinamidase/nicotinamidase-like protein [Dacryopinax primogenitus]